MKSGFVSVVGRPNVGKSTLVNALVGTKVAITSARPQTTRRTIRGVLDTEDFQIVFVDTPGIHRPKTALGTRLNSLVEASIKESDAVLFVIEATGKIGPGDRRIAERLIGGSPPVVCVVNKTDAASAGDITERLVMAGEWDFAAYVPVSALEQANLEPIVDELTALLPEGPKFFPPGMPTDQAEDFMIAEIVREKFLSRLHEEIPHSLAVLVDDVSVRADGLTRIEARLIVERESQKGIVIGKGGMMIKEAGTEARLELEKRLGTPVHLELRAKVEKDWQSHPTMIERLGM